MLVRDSGDPVNHPRRVTGADLRLGPFLEDREQPGVQLLDDSFN